MKTVLIGEGSGEFARRLKRFLKQSCRVRVVPDGDGLREALEETRADLLVLDLHLPGLDPVGFLRDRRLDGTLPPVLALTRFMSGYLAQALGQCGITYLIVRPCLPETVAERARELLAEAAEDPVRTGVRRLLERLSVPLDLNGGKYLLSAIPRVMEQGKLYLTKELYPAVGKEFGAEWTLVERCIRHAISLGWNAGDRALWLRHFPGGKPKNGEFISTMAEMARGTFEFPDDTWKKRENCG